jgi:hypothetical protein
MMPKSALLILPLFLAACSDTSATAAADGKAAAKPTVNAAALPATVSQPEQTSVTGKVLETMNAGPYTYLRLKTPGGEIWAAVNEAKLKTGDEVTVANAMWMENFESKTLNRKFERILFGSLASEGQETALPPGHPPTAASAGALQEKDTGDVNVEKAVDKDAKTVAEIWAGKTALKGLEVVRGRVVKFNPEIMGRNWIHLRDGSGTAEKQDNDITVTTTDLVKKGDIVTLRGRVVLDQDFTAGYAYPVMLEGARVVK